MLPLTDTVRPARLPIVTIALVCANVIVWLGYQLTTGIDASVEQLGDYACGLDSSCDTPLPWGIGIVTSMFTHGSWSHLVGNMVFLSVFGPRVEDELGRARYLFLYVVAGICATLLFDATTLVFLADDEAAVPSIGASGAISGVLGAYAVAYPFQRVVTWVAPVLFLRIPALGLLGVWLVLQVVMSTYSLEHPSELTGVAFAAHVGGFVVGALLQILWGHGFGVRYAPGRASRL
jgi:membrane associated rhomboid family serine protease